ncbi:MAG: hypothetical protein LBT04_06300 [Prevotellaceae bacterium]|jgi:hypothetical protein|nr:hypothetical protein [Prevotellaceae bacterium]
MSNIVFKILVFLVLLPVPVFSQSSDTVVNIKGYFLTTYSKEDIIKGLEYKIMHKKTKRNLDGMICVLYGECFVPSAIDSIFFDNETILKNIQKDFHYEKRDTFYYYPTGLSYEYVCKFFKLKINDDTLLWQKLIIDEARHHLSPYYQFVNMKKTVIKCVYLEGYAVKKTIPNNGEIARFEGSDEWTKKETNYVSLFILTKITNYTTIIDLPNLKVWYPYLEDVSE